MPDAAQLDVHLSLGAVRQLLLLADWQSAAYLRGLVQALLPAAFKVEFKRLYKKGDVSMSVHHLLRPDDLLPEHLQLFEDVFGQLVMCSPGDETGISDSWLLVSRPKGEVTRMCWFTV